MVKLAASFLTADFANLKAEIVQAERAGVDWLHLDVMDGHFVPNMSFGPMVIRSIRKVTKLPFDTHLMISNPDIYLEEFREAGSDRITVHYETCVHLSRTIAKIRELGARVGVSLNPSSPLSLLRDILSEVDLVLIMSVNPGFGGQEFLPFVLKKIEESALLIKSYNRNILLEVDGGIDATNIRKVAEAGADVIVAGAAIFNAGRVAANVKLLRKKLASVR
ncbi:MAG: ribulose-phosphate 3-epimerase [Bacteroidota bacterium]